MRIVCGLGQASCLCPGVHLAGPSERHKRHVHLALASRDHGQSCRDDKEFHAEGADQKEAGVVEEVTAGWYVYDSTTKVWSEQAGVRVVRYAAAVVYRTSSTESTRSPKASQELKSVDEKQAKAKKDAHKLKRQSSQRKELSQKPTEKDIMDTRFQLHSDSGLAPASADAKLHQAHERALEEFQSFLPHESVCARATKSNKNVT